MSTELMDGLLITLVITIATPVICSLLYWLYGATWQKA